MSEKVFRITEGENQGGVRVEFSHAGTGVETAVEFGPSGIDMYVNGQLHVALDLFYMSEGAKNLPTLTGKIVAHMYPTEKDPNEPIHSGDGPVATAIWKEEGLVIERGDEGIGHTIEQKNY